MRRLLSASLVPLLVAIFLGASCVYASTYDQLHNRKAVSLCGGHSKCTELPHLADLDNALYVKPLISDPYWQPNWCFSNNTGCGASSVSKRFFMTLEHAIVDWDGLVADTDYEYYGLGQTTLPDQTHFRHDEDAPEIVKLQSAVLIESHNSDSYVPWMMSSLLRLMIVSDMLDADPSLSIISHPTAWSLELLEMLGYADRIVSTNVPTYTALHEHTLFHVDRLIVPSPVDVTRPDLDLIELVRSKMQLVTLPPDERRTVVYFSNPMILNDEDLIEMLLLEFPSHNIEVLTIDYLLQPHLLAKILERASVLVGAHGPGLVASMFAPRGVRVLELVQSTNANPLFWHISNELGHRHHLFPVPDSWPGSNMTIPLPEFADYLWRLLNEPSPADMMTFNANSACMGGTVPSMRLGECRKCSPGYAAAHGHCMMCTVGTYSVEVDGQHECQPCAELGHSTVRWERSFNLTAAGAEWNLLPIFGASSASVCQLPTTHDDANNAEFDIEDSLWRDVASNDAAEAGVGNRSSGSDRRSVTETTNVRAVRTAAASGCDPTTSDSFGHVCLDLNPRSGACPWIDRSTILYRIDYKTHLYNTFRFGRGFMGCYNFLLPKNFRFTWFQNPYRKIGIFRDGWIRMGGCPGSGQRNFNQPGFDPTDLSTVYIAVADLAYQLVDLFDAYNYYFFFNQEGEVLQQSLFDYRSSELLYSSIFNLLFHMVPQYQSTSSLTVSYTYECDTTGRNDIAVDYTGNPSYAIPDIGVAAVMNQNGWALSPPGEGATESRRIMSKIYVSIVGTQPHMSLFVAWENMRNVPNSEHATFQIQLHQNGDDVQQTIGFERFRFVGERATVVVMSNTASNFLTGALGPERSGSGSFDGIVSYCNSAPPSVSFCHQYTQLRPGTSSSELHIRLPPTVEEGGAIMLEAFLSGFAVGSDGVPVLYEWDLDSDGVFGEIGFDATHGNENTWQVRFDTVDSFSQVSLAAGTYQVRVRASYQCRHLVGTTCPVSSVSSTITILPARPSVDPGGPYGPQQAVGGTMSLIGIVSDPAQRATVQWDLDNDAVFGESSFGAWNGHEDSLGVLFSVPVSDSTQHFTVYTIATNAGNVSDITSATVTIPPDARPCRCPRPAALPYVALFNNAQYDSSRIDRVLLTRTKGMVVRADPLVADLGFEAGATFRIANYGFASPIDARIGFFVTAVDPSTAVPTTFSAATVRYNPSNTFPNAEADYYQSNTLTSTDVSLTPLPFPWYDRNEHRIVVRYTVELNFLQMWIDGVEVLSFFTDFLAPISANRFTPLYGGFYADGTLSVATPTFSVQRDFRFCSLSEFDLDGSELGN